MTERGEYALRLAYRFAIDVKLKELKSARAEPRLEDWNSSLLEREATWRRGLGCLSFPPRLRCASLWVALPGVGAARAAEGSSGMGMGGIRRRTFLPTR